MHVSLNASRKTALMVPVAAALERDGLASSRPYYYLRHVNKNRQVILAVLTHTERPECQTAEGVSTHRSDDRRVLKICEN